MNIVCGLTGVVTLWRELRSGEGKKTEKEYEKLRIHLNSEVENLKSHLVRQYTNGSNVDKEIVKAWVGELDAPKYE